MGKDQTDAPGSLGQLRSLTLWGNARQCHLNCIAKIKSLVSLREMGGIDALDISPVGELSQLRLLEMGVVKRLAGFSSLSRLTKLGVLRIGSWTAVPTVAPLDGLGDLRELHLMFKGESPDLSGLGSLRLSKCPKVTDISPLRRCPLLAKVDLYWEGAADLSPLRAAANSRPCATRPTSEATMLLDQSGKRGYNQSERRESP